MRVYCGCCGFFLQGMIRCGLWSVGTTVIAHSCVHRPRPAWGRLHLCVLLVWSDFSLAAIFLFSNIPILKIKRILMLVKNTGLTPAGQEGGCGSASLALNMWKDHCLQCLSAEPLAPPTCSCFELATRWHSSCPSLASSCPTNQLLPKLSDQIAQLASCGCKYILQCNSPAVSTQSESRTGHDFRTILSCCST